MRDAPLLEFARPKGSFLPVVLPEPINICADIQQEVTAPPGKALDLQLVVELLLNKAALVKDPRRHTEDVSVITACPSGKSISSPPHQRILIVLTPLYDVSKM
jgi:hypothetical protein